VVDAFTTQDLALACRLFLELAYPDGAHSIPDSKRPYCDIPSDASPDDYLPPAKLATSVCQDLSQLKGGVRGYEFRLGSMAHPHLKLRIQIVDFHDRDVWVYSVDTHDRFLRATQHLNPEDAKTWRRLLEQNRSLKHRIEEALASAGYLTPKSLMKLDLTVPVKP
jgi:hypothetical protein